MHQALTQLGERQYSNPAIQTVDRLVNPICVYLRPYADHLVNDVGLLY